MPRGIPTDTSLSQTPLLRPRASTPPEANLWLETLKEGIETYLKTDKHSWPWLEANAWLRSHVNRVGSFIFCCQVNNIDAAFLRERLLGEGFRNASLGTRNWATRHSKDGIRWGRTRI